MVSLEETGDSDLKGNGRRKAVHFNVKWKTRLGNVAGDSETPRNTRMSKGTDRWKREGVVQGLY